MANIASLLDRNLGNTRQRPSALTQDSRITHGENAADVKGAMVTGFDVEVLYLALKWGYKIKEVPVSWHDTPGTKVRLLKDASRSMAGLMKIRMNDMRGIYK